MVVEFEHRGTRSLTHDARTHFMMTVRRGKVGNGGVTYDHVGGEFGDVTAIGQDRHARRLVTIHTRTARRTLQILNQVERRIRHMNRHRRRDDVEEGGNRAYPIHLRPTGCPSIGGDNRRHTARRAHAREREDRAAFGS